MARKNVTLIVCLLLFMLPGVVWAGPDIVIVQGIKIKPYELAFHGFDDVCHYTVSRYVLSEERDNEQLVCEIKRIKPALILTIGTSALAFARKFPDIPVVAIMVMNATGKNVKTVRMIVSPQKQIELLLKTLPGCKRIGLLYDPENTGWLVDEIRSAAHEKGIDLISLIVHDPRDIPIKIKELKGKIDAFWLLPDITVVNPNTIQFLFLSLMGYKIPVLSFSPKYLKLGALISVSAVPYDMGAQAGEMTNRIILQQRDTVKYDAVNVYARKARVLVNQEVLRKFSFHQVMHNTRLQIGP